MLHVALLTRRLEYRGVRAWNMPPEKYFETLETHKNKCVSIIIICTCEMTHMSLISLF